MSSVSAVTGGVAGAGDRPASSLRLPADAVAATLARMLGPASSFLLAIVLARALGPEGAGVLYVTLTLVAAMTIVAKFGLETALQRFVGAASGRNDPAAVLGIYRQSLHACMALALPTGALTFALAPTIAAHVLGEPSRVDVVQSLGLLVVPTALLGISAATLKALGRPAWGGLLEAGAWPLLTLVLAGLSVADGPISLQTIAMVYLLAAAIAAAIGHLSVRRSLPAVSKPAPMCWTQLRQSCLSLTGIELINYALLWAPFVMLPVLSGADQAGLYGVSHRLAAQLGLLMLVVASITCARFATHHELGQHAELARLAGRATRLMLVLALPPALTLMLFGEAVLSLFGDGFSPAATALQVLLAGQLVNLATGPAGYLLAMTGHERALRNILLTTTALILLLALALIPSLGATGAAAAVAVAMAFHSIACARAVARRLRLPFLLALAR